MTNTSKHKILLVISSLAGRGGERSVLTLGKGFHEVGCEVHILCFSDTQDYDKNPNLHYHVLESKRWYDKLITREMRYQHMAKDFDSFVKEQIGECQLILANLIQQHRILYHSQLPKIAYVIRNTLSKEYAIAIKKNPNKFLSRFRQIYKKHPCICVSKGVENDLNATLNTQSTTVGVTHTIYNPFDKSQMIQMSKAYTPNLKDYIVHIGTFSHAKAHDVLLKAYANSSQKYPLVLLGKGKRLEQTKQLASDLGIKDQVHFLGFNKNPYPYIKNAKAMILSSRFEGFGRVILEALALNTPVVSTDCPSGPNEVLPSHNLVNVDDIEHLAKKITDVMGSPNEFIVPFDEKFLPKNIAQQYIKFLSVEDI